MLNKPRLLTPGPTPLPDRVRLAMARDMLHHRKSAFKDIMVDVQQGLAELFGTAQPVLPLTCSGTGAMVAAVCNLFAPGERVLVVEGGRFGERWSEICREHGVAPVPLPVAWGEAVDPDRVESMLDEDPALKGVLVQLSETSTCVQHPVARLGRVTRDRNVLLVVDGISGVSITPCPMDAWGIDCLLTGSQKGLMLPPGLALVALSERAWKRADRIEPRNYYFNLRKERENWGKSQTSFTPAVGLIMGLAESLAMFRETGLEHIFRKQWALACMARTGAAALGFELLAKKDFAWGVTGILLPAGVPSKALLARAAASYGVIMAAGQGHLKEQVVRLGHMGWVDYADLAAGLNALARSFTACGGYLGARNYLEQALDAYWTALDQGYPDDGTLA